MQRRTGIVVEVSEYDGSRRPLGFQGVARFRNSLLRAV